MGLNEKLKKAQFEIQYAAIDQVICLFSILVWIWRMGKYELVFDVWLAFCVSTDS